MAPTPTADLPYGLRDETAYVEGQRAAKEYATRNGFDENTFQEIRVQWNDQVRLARHREVLGDTRLLYSEAITREAAETGRM